MEESSLRSPGAGAREPTYAEAMPTETANLMLGLERRVQAMRPGWNSMLSYAEQQAMMANARCLSSIAHGQWETICAYLATKLPEGDPGYQPRSRLKFIENLPDVLGHATEWRRKQRPAVVATPSALKPMTAISREALAEVFGKKS
jgi:hypothetical protein